MKRRNGDILIRKELAKKYANLMRKVIISKGLDVDLQPSRDDLVKLMNILYGFEPGEVDDR